MTIIGYHWQIEGNPLLFWVNFFRHQSWTIHRRLSVTYENIVNQVSLINASILLASPNDQCGNHRNLNVCDGKFFLDVSSLENNIIAQNSVSTNLDCALECLADNRCKDFNFKEPTERLNEMDFKFYFHELCAKMQKSFFNTCVKKNFSFWQISWEIICHNTRTRLPVGELTL